MQDRNQLFNAMAILGILLAIGMSAAAFILGVQGKSAVTGQQTIAVKGLAQKPIQADSAEWIVRINVTATTQSTALKLLSTERVVLEKFLVDQGLASDTWQVEIEYLSPHYEEIFIKDTPRQVQNGFDAYQNIRISSKELDKITAANKAILGLRADNHPIVADAPLYLVGDLENIKMSLIADATKNARARATEFVKQDGVKVGVMKSASQGAFYILPMGGDAGDDSYGGVYDKSTIEKTARVVVTIVYNIE